jgi:hypothetical protein
MDVESILGDAIAIIRQDVDKIKDLSKAEIPLDRIEAAKLTDYIKVLINVNKNEREIEKLEKLNTISDEELSKLAKEALATMEEAQEQELKETESEDSKPSKDKKDEGGG